MSNKQMDHLRKDTQGGNSPSKAAAAAKSTGCVSKQSNPSPRHLSLSQVLFWLWPLLRFLAGQGTCKPMYLLAKSPDFTHAYFTARDKM